MKFIRSILSLILAVLVLVSSTSFSVSLHVCRGHVRDIGVMQDAKPCAMELMAADLGFSGSDCASGRVMKCCEDRTLTFEGNDYQYKTSQQFTLHDLIPVPAVLPLPDSFFSQIVSSRYTAFDSYKPPLITHDVTVLVQSFLI